MPYESEPRVLDMNLACLVCLTEESGTISVYGQDWEPPHMIILDKIRRSTGLQLDSRTYVQMKTWPDKICPQCHIELTVAYRFREKCSTVEKLFQSPTGYALEEQLKQQLEQHHLRLPATLKIKRLELEPVVASSGGGGSVRSSLATATESSYYQDIVQKEDEEEELADEESEAEAVPSTATTTAGAVTLLPDEGMVLSLEDLDDSDPIKMGPEDITTSDDEEEEVEDKLLALAPWDNDQTPEHLYEIETPIMEEELPPPTLIPPPPPPLPPPAPAPAPAQATSKLRKRTYRRVPPIVKQESSRVANSSTDLDKDFQPVTVASSKRRHAERSPKICDVCGNTYKYQHALNAHMRRHNNERPYPCEVCQKAFISNVELRRHMRVHTGQKPYGCKFCDRRFSDFGSSKKHERIHTGERPYVCEVCHKGFAYAHVLSVHRRTHTGKKQFQCTKCDKGFTKKSYLSAHMEQHRGSGGSGEGLPGEEEDEGMGAGFHAVGDLRLSERKPDPFSLDSVVLGEQNKVLEECIVTNDFMFNEEDDDDDDREPDVDENEEAEAAEDHHESYPPQPDFDEVDYRQGTVKELVDDLCEYLID